MRKSSRTNTLDTLVGVGFAVAAIIIILGVLFLLDPRYHFWRILKDYRKNSQEKGTNARNEPEGRSSSIRLQKKSVLKELRGRAFPYRSGDSEKGSV